MATVFKITSQVRRFREMPVGARRTNQDWREYKKAPRLYVWPEGESVLENLQNRHFRPYKYWLEHVVPQVLKEFDLKPTKVRWSQKAGCSCGCSPGFILEGVVGTFDISVNVEVKEV